jgi:5-methyltetrahydrofolate--homocysteine methyltransferase
MKKTVLETLREKVLVADGAMGTQLMAAGLEQGNCGEMWNVTHPDRVLAIQRRYVEAGSDCLITNTFGGNGLMLKRHHHFDDLVAINHASVRIARQAFGDSEGFVFGDVGPVGGVMEPYGDLTVEEVREAVRMQIRALVESGVDAVIMETQMALEEVELGVQAAQELGAPCIIASMAYDRSRDGTFFKTMMGIAPERAAEYLSDLGVDILALNCGTGVDMAVAEAVITAYRDVADCFTMAQPNAGLPVLENLKAVYKQTPEDMVAPLDGLLAAGVNIVGGCCGSTPDHIRAIRHKVDAWNAKEISRRTYV